MQVQFCALLADPRVKQSEVRSFSEALVELAVESSGSILPFKILRIRLYSKTGKP